MNPQPITFKKPFKLVQLFRNINSYGKEERSFEDRKEKIAWKPIQSTAGYVKDEIIHLPETILDQTNFEHSDLIVVIDDNFTAFQNVIYTKEKNLCFRSKSLNQFDFLQIKLDEKIELYLKPGYFEVGVPMRNEFKICELSLQKPISIKINGKRNFSASSRRERVFVEQDYIFNYLGDFNQVNLVKEQFDPVEKTIPRELKIIDLMKTLY